MIQTWILGPDNLYEISEKTGYSQAELDMMYMNARDRGEEYLVQVETKTTFHLRRKKQEDANT